MAEAGAPTSGEIVEIEIDPLAELPRILDWLPEALIPLWEVVSQFPIVGALIVAAVAFLLALFVRFVIFHSLSRLASMTSSVLDDVVLEHLRKPVFTTVLYFGLALAVRSAQLIVGTQLIVKLLLSVIVASWMRALLRISTSLLHALEHQTRFSLIEARTVPMFDLSAKLITILVGSYALLLIWGINPVGWLASAGIVGIAVGFAAKDTLANLFSGFFIVADAPYKIGDYITLDTGERGKVSAIGLRSTRLLTRADVEITIPNGVIANAKIVNESGGPYLKIRVGISVGVAYGSDVDQVCALLEHIAVEHAEVCTFPAPRVRMRGFGASSLDFDLLVWIEHPENRGRISHDLYLQIYKTFADENIEIPYAKQDLYIKEWPQRSDSKQER
ncbi:MAG: mechanosensitive ion channel family protein [Gammaproteobacteria bacterium]|nr:mechanosensitive ion channel family protein [Gammaproteobacteria bacterium]